MRVPHNNTQAVIKPSASNETLLDAAEYRQPRAYLTVAELSEELSISSRTAYYLISTGDIPHVRVGRSIRVYRATLEEWRREQEEVSKKKAPSPEKVEASDPSKGSTHAIVQA